MGFLNGFFGKKTKDSAGFLSILSERERLAVGNLSPMAYQAIIQEKEGKEIELRGIDGATLGFLRRLSVPELHSLEKSAKSLVKADQLSESDLMEAAAAAYREAFETNPYNDLALMSYGCALANSGNLREGIKWVERALSVNPDNPRAKKNLEGMRARL